jgi:glycosyltransferase involved in cell wall biosynthesis
MKLLFIHRRDFQNGVGGVAEYLHYLPLALKKQGIEPVLYSEGESKQITGPYYLPNGMPVYYGPFVRPSIFTSAQKINIISEWCQSLNISLIHAQSAYRSGFLAWKLYEKTRIPYIITSHSDIIPTHSKRMQKARVKKRCSKILQHATKVIHLTPLIAEISNQVYDTSAKSAIISNGIDTSSWAYFTSLLEKNYLLGIGRLEPGKGFHILISAYAELCKQGCKEALVIAGSGPSEVSLKEQVKRCGLNLMTDVNDISGLAELPASTVFFTGYVKGDIKKRLFTQSKLVLFPTQPRQWEEVFSIVQLEAMAAGKAIVASDAKTTRYLQTLGMQALFAEAEDPLAWAKQIHCLLNEAELREKLGKANRINAQQFDWNQIAQQYADVYLSLTNGPTGLVSVSDLLSPLPAS